MPQDERGFYVPWYPTRYLLSRTRFRLGLAERSIYRDILDMIYEAGGRIVYDEGYICHITGATEEQLRHVVGTSALELADGNLSHPVCADVIKEMVDFRESGRRGGVESGRARREKALKIGALEGGSQPRSDGGSRGVASRATQGGSEGGSPGPGFSLDEIVPPSERTTKQKEGRKEGINKGTSPAGARDPALDGFARSEVIHNGSHGAAPARAAGYGGMPATPRRAEPPSLLTPERTKLLLDGCQNPNDRQRDHQRPWLTREFGAWYGRQTILDQLAISSAFEQRTGFSFDHGPTARVETLVTPEVARSANGASGAPGRNGAILQESPAEPTYERADDLVDPGLEDSL